METRIKYVKKNNAWYYDVQVKKWIFWKTLKLCNTWLAVDEFFNELKKVEEYNNKIKSLNKIVYDGYAVRNVYRGGTPAYSINFFNSSVHKRKHNNEVSEITWVDFNDNIIPTIEITEKTLFGKECLEPMKLRITIEQIDE